MNNVWWNFQRQTYKHTKYLPLNPDVLYLRSLQELEGALEEIQNLRGASLTQLEGQLQESRDILTQMDKNFKGELLQNLMTVILSMDKDGNMILSNEEIDELIQTLEGLHGVQLKEDLLKQAIIALWRV